LEPDEALNPRRTGARRGIGRFWPSMAVFLLALAVVAMLHDEPPASAPATAAVHPPPTPERHVPAIPALVSSTTAAAIVASDGLPVMPHTPREAVPSGPVHPHPITAAHHRIYRENNLLHALNGALDVKDAAGMRRLLERYREDYPEDASQLQEGYALIADCLEQPDAATVERAQAYYASETASTLRRYVRRHCLERVE
jgi:hypothetical protein